MRSRMTFGMVLLIAVALALPASAQIVMPTHIVPVVVKASGYAGTDWRSDLSISNLSDGRATVGLAYFPANHDNSWMMTFPVSVDIPAKGTLQIEDVIGTFFSSYGTNTKGALFVMLEDVQGGVEEPRLAVSSRAYNAANPERTYGQTVPSTQLGIVSGEGVSVMTGVRQDARFRTNIGVVNLSSTLYPTPQFQRLEARIRIYNGQGTLVYDGVKEVEGLSLRQWNLEQDFGIDELSAGRVEVSVDPSTEGYDPCATSYGFMGTSPSPALLAYYSKVDNATGDAEFGIGQVDWTRHREDCGEAPTDDCGGSSGD